MFGLYRQKYNRTGIGVNKAKSSLTMHLNVGKMQEATLGH